MQEQLYEIIVIGGKYINIIMEYINGKKDSKTKVENKCFINSSKNINYFCYRYHIPKQLKAGLHDDVGWGCIIRCGQMMLCNVLDKYYDDGRIFFSDICEKEENGKYTIHKIVTVGEKYGIPIGNWFSPSILAHTLKYLSQEEERIQIIIAKDGFIYEDEIDKYKDILLLVPQMLGIETINKQYYDYIKKCISCRYSYGIIGGEPRKSYYFIGNNDEELLYLDPHSAKPANETNVESCEVKSINISKLDPCMMMCFVLDYEDIEHLVKDVSDGNFSLLKSNMKKDLETKNNDDWIEI